MNDERKNRVFLSYASEDLEKGKVKPVYEGLIKRKLDVWFDKVHLKKGRWKNQIRKAIARSRHFVICISEAALKKTGDDTPGFQDEELDYAYSFAEDQPDKEFTIIPVRLEDCTRGDFRIASFQQYDLFEDFDRRLDKLAVDMGGISLSDAKAKDERSEEEKLIDGLLAKATTEYYAGRYEACITILNSSLVFSPNDARTWNGKGIALAELNQKEEAISAFAKAIQIDPSMTEAWSNTGSVYRKLGQIEESIVAYDKALEINPNSAVAWYNKGNILNELGQFEEAIQAFDKAILINPKYSHAWFNEGNCLSALGRYKESIEAFDQALQIDPNDAEVWFNKGVDLDQLSLFKDAIDAYNRVLSIDPNFFLAFYVWLYKGLALIKEGAFEEAQEALVEATKINPKNADAWFLRGVACQKLDQNEKALLAFKMSLQINPNNSEAINRINEIMTKPNIND